MALLLPRCCFHLSLCEVPRELIAQENESAGHQRRIGCKRMFQEAALHAPVTQPDEHGRQGQNLADLHANIEADDVGDETTLGER